MGFNSNRVVLSSKTLPTSRGRKMSSSNMEPVGAKIASECSSSVTKKNLSNGSSNAPTKKNLSNGSSNAHRKHYSISSIREKIKGTISSSSLRRSLEMENSSNPKYGKDKKNLACWNQAANVELRSKSNRPPHLKIPTSSKTHVPNGKTGNLDGKTGNLGGKDNVISNPCCTHRSPPPSNSLKPGNIHSSHSSLPFSSRKRKSQCTKFPPSSKMGDHNEKTENLGVKDNGISNPCHTHHSPCSSNSTKPANIHSSPSSMSFLSRESPNPVIPRWEKGLGTGNYNNVKAPISNPCDSYHSPCSFDSRKPANVHSSPSSMSFSSRESPNSVLPKRERSSLDGNQDNIKAPMNLDNGSVLKENPHMSQPSQAHNCQHSENVLSFGNIYKGFRNAVGGKVPSLAKQTHKNNTLATFKGDVVGKGKDSETVQSNRYVLGFGGCNYGHGSIIKGARKAKNVTGNSCSDIGSNNKECQQFSPAPSMIPNSKDVEELKNAGNEEYKKGRFAKAISLYDQALALCPRNAPCHNDKAAALAGLQRYMEAVDECLDAIECDPSYSHAHYRLGSLYTRLGRLEDAKWHFQLSGQQFDSNAMHTILHIESHLLNMERARNVGDWYRVLAESNWAIDAGANASDQVLACKAEALLKLHKAKEALELLMAAKKSDTEKSKKIHKGDSSLLIIETQVYMYLGRFDDGLMAAERAANFDCRPELLMWLRKARAAADARKTGNELFSAGKYLEACIVYGQGLEHAPMNCILLCNRAACRSKLGQWEMAVEDCNAALKSRPDYTKALLRRAHANVKLGRWEESLRDYEVLSQEMPGDVYVAQSLLQVQSEIKRVQCGPGNLHFSGKVTEIKSYSQFLKIIKLAGLALLEFFMKSDDACKRLSPLINELSQRYPSWNFLKVDIEQNPDWAELERIKFVPIFIIYKDGLKLREICRPDRQILEHALKFHSN